MRFAILYGAVIVAEAVTGGPVEADWKLAVLALFFLFMDVTEYFRRVTA